MNREKPETIEPFKVGEPQPKPKRPPRRIRRAISSELRRGTPPGQIVEKIRRR